MSVLKRLLERTPVEVLRTPGDARAVVEIASTLAIADGFQVLLDERVLSAPVYDPAAHTYVGFLDLRDLVSWAVFLFDEQENPADDVLDLINAAHKLYKHATGGLSLSCLFFFPTPIIAPFPLAGQKHRSVFTSLGGAPHRPRETKPVPRRAQRRQPRQRRRRPQDRREARPRPQRRGPRRLYHLPDGPEPLPL